MKPEKCPKCNHLLKEIIEERSAAPLIWNKEKGKYEVEDAQAQGQYLCGKCNKVIGGWRADGETWGVQPEVD